MTGNTGNKSETTDALRTTQVQFGHAQDRNQFSLQEQHKHEAGGKSFSPAIIQLKRASDFTGRKGKQGRRTSRRLCTIDRFAGNGTRADAGGAGSSLFRKQTNTTICFRKIKQKPHRVLCSPFTQATVVIFQSWRNANNRSASCMAKVNLFARSDRQIASYGLFEVSDERGQTQGSSGNRRVLTFQLSAADFAPAAKTPRPH